MNKIRQIQELNKKELEQGISPNASWHTDYRDTAFVYFGGLPYDLSEGDIITIFSQYGEPVFLKLARDQETGKSKGFGWLKYEDQRSTDLAVDNLGGAQIGGRMISVDHARYKARDDEDADEFKVGWADMQRRLGAGATGGGGGDNSDTDMGEATPSEGERKQKKKSIRSRGDGHQPLLREERELQKLIDEHDDEDPMKDFLVEEKKREVDEARRLRDSKGDGERRHRHRSHRSHRSHRDDDEASSRRDDKDGDRREHRHRRRDDDGDTRRDRSDRDRERDRNRDRDRRRDELDDDESHDRRREHDRGQERYRDRNRDLTRDAGKDSSHRRRDRDRKDDRDDQDRDRERRH
ncbi:u2 snrnp component ist3 [Sporothrix brasiliensis 5110]|uniref:U2 snrnp component ist3 n=1 Tax=Sporothrix brasiliensis 5110 TaxID=1398154 RepID=A0A0C2FRW0_9PEZI|nr:u2 snrnp component ist3 [Sporothrix brasiliensis 5110]KIH93748.1 u2 snrnp component ist3 [Sporothrix brasiliensis 5110]